MEKAATRTKGSGSEQLTQERNRSPELARSGLPPQEYCSCRVCIAVSLARALRQINRGRHLIAADIVSLSIFDLTEDATFVRTPAGTMVPLCEG